MKLARRYQKIVRGEENRVEFVSMNASFHGRTLASITATGQPNVGNYGYGNAVAVVIFFISRCSELYGFRKWINNQPRIWRAWPVDIECRFHIQNKVENRSVHGYITHCIVNHPIKRVN